MALAGNTVLARHYHADNLITIFPFSGELHTALHLYSQKEKTPMIGSTSLIQENQLLLYIYIYLRLGNGFQRQFLGRLLAWCAAEICPRALLQVSGISLAPVLRWRLF